MEAGSLEAKALRQFDALVKREELFWQPNTPRLVQTGPFKFQFRSAPSFTKKPIQAADDPGRSSDQNVFSDTDPDFVIDFIGPSHKLILNKYCVVRPQFILHTTVFTPQSDHLNEVDLDAAWNVLRRLKSRHMAIYNCGFEAGSSIGHKHLQVLPRPEKEEFELFPDALGVDHEKNAVRNLPFRHAVKKLSSNPDLTELVWVYASLKLLSGVEKAHNIILVDEWMLVIPRSCAKHGNLAANAASMAGMVWVTTSEDVQDWIDRGSMELLCQFGVVKK
ncbi:Ap4A phosphorylase II [Rhexocercosporidium sp. MPI-PUGE-AT-0058]|nr:Ap4A phosphorylase II [Rhexocercosporidium sp. MPI-PUGE-AT-0058]